MSTGMGRPIRSPLLIAAATLSIGAPGAHAGGMYIGDNGGQALARSGAFVVKADDPTAIVHNPAGLAKVDGAAVYLSVNVVGQNNSFQRSGQYGEEIVFPIFGTQPDFVGDDYPTVLNESPAQPIPMVSAAVRAGNFAFAAGFFAPHAVAGRSFSPTVRSQSSDEAPAPQRYDTLDQGGIAGMPSVAMAYSFGRVRVGGRASWGFAGLETTKVQQIVGNDAESTGLDATATLTASDSFVFTWGVGAQIEVAPWLELGAAYSGPLEVQAVGTANVQLSDLITSIPIIEAQVEPVPDEMAQCAPGGEVGAIKACVDFTLPASANIGARLVQRSDGREVGDLEFNLRWEDWSSASQQRAVIDGQDSITGMPLGETVVESGFHDSFALKLAASRRARASWAELEFRAGASYDGPAKPKNWTTISNDGAARYSGAAGMAIERGRYRVDIGAMLSVSDTITVAEAPTPFGDGEADQPTTDAPIGAGHAFNAGTYVNNYWAVSLGLQAGF